MALVVPLPIHTVSEANQREHWSKRAKRAAEQRSVVALALRMPVNDAGMVMAPSDQAPPKRRTKALVAPGKAILEVALTRIAPRELDDDNLRGALKAVRDGVADVLGINDRDPRVQWSYRQRRGDVREYGVQITLAKLPAQESMPLANVM